MVILVLATVVFAVPVGAATGPPGENAAPGPTGVVTVPNPGSESAGPKSNTPTTTSTTKPGGTTTSTPGTNIPDPTADLTPTAGPPELAKKGVMLPNDSLAAAMAELTLERAKVDQIQQHRLTIDDSIQAHETKLKRVRTVRKHEEAKRQDRAVAMYRGQSSGWRLGVLTDRQLSDERAVYLVAAVDAASRAKIKVLDRTEARLERLVDAERSDQGSMDVQLEDALARLNRLLDKLAANNGTITTINGDLVFVPTGPSPVALLADAADQQLFRLILAQTPPATDGPWLAARHTLALELARAKVPGDRQTTAAAIERDWDVTPPSVLHATLFALRQVGKAYVYATDGPDTFDCSGLTKAAYAQIRLGLPHFSGAQLHVGVPVPPEALRPGDLLTYGPDGSEHVTMFIGGGLVVAAKGRAYGVIIEPARVDPLKGFAGATRIVP